MKKFLLMTQGSQINNFATVNSGDLVSIGNMINDMDGWTGYALMTDRRRKNNNTNLIDVNFEEAMDMEFDLIVTSQFSANAFGGKVGQSFIEFTKYCQKYPTTPILQYSVDIRIGLNPLYLRFEEHIIENPVFPVVVYTKEDYLEMSKKDNVTNIKEIYEFDMNMYSIYMIKHYPEIYIDYNVVDNSPDLIYGGQFRPQRKPFFDEFLNEDHTNIELEVYGNLNKRGYGNVKCKKVHQSQMIAKNSTGLATILPYEDGYGYDNIVQVRIYESLASSAVTFIHKNWDPNMELLPMFKNRYVDSYDQLEERILFLKDNSNVREAMLREQHEYIKNANTDTSELKNIIEEIINYEY